MKKSRNVERTYGWTGDEEVEEEENLDVSVERHEQPYRVVHEWFNLNERGLSNPQKINYLVQTDP
jgi:hypothetical protein